MQLKKKMYSTIKSYYSDYPSKNELKWIFDPIITICFITNIYRLNCGIYKKFGDENTAVLVKNIIIISKNLDNRINSLIHFFKGIIEYSYSTNLTPPVVKIPVVETTNNFCLPHIYINDR